jgi:hypothetical protein
MSHIQQLTMVYREAWLMNWLANLSGKVNGFKEMDLLQEHQNFWACFFTFLRLSIVQEDRTAAGSD